MGPTWGPSGADRTQVGPMLALWTLLSSIFVSWLVPVQSYDYTPGPLFTKEAPYYGYRNPYYKPKMVWEPSRVHHGNPYTNNAAYSWCLEAQRNKPGKYGKLDDHHTTTKHGKAATGTPAQYKHGFSSYRDSCYKTRRSWERLILIIEISTLVRWHL